MLTPLFCGILSAIIMYLFVYVENKKIDDKTLLKISSVSGVLVWGFSNIMLQNLKNENFFEDYTVLNENF